MKLPDADIVSAYEAECVRAVRHEVQRESPLLSMRERSVEIVGLEGWAPETKLIVIFERAGTSHTYDWRVWDETLLPPGGQMSDASQAWTLASVVIAHLIE